MAAWLARLAEGLPTVILFSHSPFSKFRQLLLHTPWTYMVYSAFRSSSPWCLGPPHAPWLQLGYGSREPIQMDIRSQLNQSMLKHSTAFILLLRTLQRDLLDYIHYRGVWAKSELTAWLRSPQPIMLLWCIHLFKSRDRFWLTLDFSSCHYFVFFFYDPASQNETMWSIRDEAEKKYNS